jgi:hypothetical protein
MDAAPSLEPFMKQEDFEKFVEYKANYDRLQDEVVSAISFIIDELFPSSDGWEFKNSEFKVTDGFVEFSVFGRAVIENHLQWSGS